MIVLLAVSVILFAIHTADAETNIRLNEIAWAGSSLSASDEWLELFNPSETEIAIGGWHIHGAASGDTEIVLPKDAKIPAGGTFIISNFPAEDERTALTQKPDFVISAISLSNSALEIRLLDANGTLIDRAGNGSAPPAGYSGEKKASMIRADAITDTWKTQTLTENLRTSDLGTPGKPEKETVADVEEPPSLPNTAESQPLSQTPSYLIQNRQFLRLNEVMAAPNDGNEWIEITSAVPDRTISLDGIELQDKTGRIAVLSGMLSPENPIRVFELASAKLNNGGDTVYLTNSGTMLDTLNYADAPKGTSWAKDAQNAWRITQIPTPGTINEIREPKPEPEPEPKSESKPKTEPQKEISQPLTVVSPASKKESDLMKTIPENETNQADQSSSTRIHLRINEFLPDPDQESEWIELYATGSGSILLDDILLSDASGVLERLSGNLDAGSYRLITLKSARLNNDGDEIRLHTENNEILDAFSYAGSRKSMSWARSDDGKWTETETPTPNMQNHIQAPEQKIENSNKEILTITHDMSYEETYGGRRVRLMGVVGTPSRHLSGRKFILLNPEGKGLEVRIPSSKKQPPINSPLSVIGTLKFNAQDLPYLSVSTKDEWTVLSKESAPPTSRRVSLFAPATEDAWSLVTATGTVQAVSGKTITILSDDTEISVKIRPDVAYLPSRLSKGDEIQVTGILNSTENPPSILPRHATELELIKSAPKKETVVAPQPKGVPGWTPFGAAAIAIGAIEGGKRIKAKIHSSTE